MSEAVVGAEPAVQAASNGHQCEERPILALPPNIIIESTSPHTQSLSSARRRKSSPSRTLNRTSRGPPDRPYAPRTASHSPTPARPANSSTGACCARNPARSRRCAPASTAADSATWAAWNSWARVGSGTGVANAAAVVRRGRDGLWRAGRGWRSSGQPGSGWRRKSGGSSR
jgi:hypothetical protein